VRIARFTTGDEPRFGVVTGESGQEALAVVAGDPLYVPLRYTGEEVPLDRVRLLAPVIPRSKVLGVARNYVAHAEEMGTAVAGEPEIFLKPNTAVVGPDDPIVLPPESSEVHHEGELAVVIGRFCRNVPRDRVGEVVLGFTCANDVTARDLQRRDGQWWRAKGFDTFCPLGPVLVTDLDVGDLRISTRLDGVTRQDSRTSLMVHDVASVVAHISSAMTLLPGDVILTGTPAGVGPMAAGQRVEVEVEGIGVLANPVVVRD
jgi:2-keto-4-pentenoate hydratase/2-oxohepta-3-ene-1,7-dioic acid hydratase in catechol pathway